MTTAQKAKLKEQKTEFVGLKEFRQGISSFATRATKTNTKYIVLKRNKPIGEYRPFTNRELGVAKLEREIAEAREQVKQGKTYTMEQVLKMFAISK